MSNPYQPPAAPTHNTAPLKRRIRWRMAGMAVLFLVVTLALLGATRSPTPILNPVPVVPPPLPLE